MTHYMIKYTGFVEIWKLDQVDIISLLLAAFIHDFGHPGLMNSYFINTKSNLAITYHDKSVLENYHIA